MQAIKLKFTFKSEKVNIKADCLQEKHQFPLFLQTKKYSMYL